MAMGIQVEFVLWCHIVLW